MQHETKRPSYGSVVLTILLMIILVAAWPTPAAAQSAMRSAKTVRALLDAAVVTGLWPGDNPAVFEANQQRLIEEIRRGIGLGITTIPLGGSSAGFAYQMDEKTGVPVLKSLSFGPLLMERPLTSGAGSFGLSVNFHGSSYQTFQGIDIRDQGLLLFNNRLYFTRAAHEQFIEDFLKIEPTVSTARVAPRANPSPAARNTTPRTATATPTRRTIRDLMPSGNQTQLRKC